MKKIPRIVTPIVPIYLKDSPVKESVKESVKDNKDSPINDNKYNKDSPEKNNKNIKVGTSGYSYDHWTSHFKTFHGFYPPGTSKNQMFSHYAKSFDFVELNTTFYGNPTEATVNSWYNMSPPNFRYLVKVNKYITHSKKLLDFDETFPRFVNLMSGLKEKCLGFLIQLPPTFKNDKRNFDRILSCKAVTDSLRSLTDCDNYLHNKTIFIEFRHTSWYCPAVYEMLRKVGWSLTITNLNNEIESYGSTCDNSNIRNKGFFPSLEEVVDGSAVTVEDTIMFRCHGTFASQPYMGGYSDDDIMMMASIASAQKCGLVVFDNTDSYQYQMDIPWLKTDRGTSQLVFDRTQMPPNLKVLLPHAIEDAIRVKSLL